MATNNAVNTSLSGQTGTGSFAGSTSPTFTSPILGTASATSLTFSSISGIIGTTTNNNAADGSVGEYVSSQISEGSFVSITAGANVTSISLTAGDWDVGGNISITFAGTDSAYSATGWISSTSNTLPDAAVYAIISQSVTTFFVSGNQYNFVVPQQRFSLSGTTTIYLSGRVGVLGGCTAGAGGLLWARRVR